MPDIIKSYPAEGTLNIKIIGKMSLYLHEKFHDAYKKELSQLKQITLDFSECDNIDSSGVGMLIVLRDACQSSGCDLTLTSLKDSTRELMERMSLTSLFNISDGAA